MPIEELREMYSKENSRLENALMTCTSSDIEEIRKLISDISLEMFKKLETRISNPAESSRRS
ncbi:MAG: hypothetical protein NVS9B7_02150 [Flavisolibacter sp.]